MRDAEVSAKAMQLLRKYTWLAEFLRVLAEEQEAPPSVFTRALGVSSRLAHTATYVLRRLGILEHGEQGYSLSEEGRTLVSECARLLHERTVAVVRRTRLLDLGEEYALVVTRRRAVSVKRVPRALVERAHRLLTKTGEWTGIREMAKALGVRGETASRILRILVLLGKAEVKIEDGRKLFRAKAEEF